MELNCEEINEKKSNSARTLHTDTLLSSSQRNSPHLDGNPVNEINEVFVEEYSIEWHDAIGNHQQCTSDANNMGVTPQIDATRIGGSGSP
ncbi:hypothetical protein NPIL_380981 [Nephila pilipes]|uniref:Uncharacterized protein n=1 Tax=Nephila pilipes TaxID=299642 RepID=A0A8X6MBJ7_NEPPI|nr:hypothetical protein NPIL_380981 [Nephila pilipes]